MEKLQVQVKMDCLRLFGAEPPETLISMGNLASIYENQGQWKWVEELKVQVKKTCLRPFRAENPDTLLRMGSPASIYVLQGRKEAM